MTRVELEHAIRSECDVAEDTEVYVFGSQAILGQYPHAPEAVRQSIEADIAPKNKPENVDLIDGALGELSLFHGTHGFYVHGVPIESATLPTGWDTRAVPVSNDNTRGHTGWCIEGHDLAASKLAAFRDKDREFVRVLLRERMVEADHLRDRLLNLPVSNDKRVVILSGHVFDETDRVPLRRCGTRWLHGAQEPAASGTLSSPPLSLNSLDFSRIPASAASRMSCEIRIEQNFGPHIEQKCDTAIAWRNAWAPEVRRADPA